MTPSGDDDSAGELPFFWADDLAERWALVRQRVHQLRSEMDPPLEAGRMLGKTGGKGIMVWSLAQVLAFEAAHPEWTARRRAIAEAKARGEAPRDE